MVLNTFRLWIKRKLTTGMGYHNNYVQRLFLTIWKRGQISNVFRIFAGWRLANIFVRADIATPKFPFVDSTNYILLYWINVKWLTNAQENVIKTELRLTLQVSVRFKVYASWTSTNGFRRFYKPVEMVLFKFHWISISDYRKQRKSWYYWNIWG